MDGSVRKYRRKLYSGSGSFQAISPTGLASARAPLHRLRNRQRRQPRISRLNLLAMGRGLIPALSSPRRRRGCGLAPARETDGSRMPAIPRIPSSAALEASVIQTHTGSYEVRRFGFRSVAPHLVFEQPNRMPRPGEPGNSDTTFPDWTRLFVNRCVHGNLP